MCSSDLIEGHMISGYADGGDAPQKPLELVPGAVDEALAFLSVHAETRKRFQRVNELVEGFESPFGLELLATVHWVIRHGNATSVDEVIKHTYGWNSRKKQFTQRQIELAVDVLIQRGWAEPMMGAK